VQPGRERIKQPGRVPVQRRRGGVDDGGEERVEGEEGRDGGVEDGALRQAGDLGVGAGGLRVEGEGVGEACVGWVREEGDAGCIG